jgi:probable F420-dependent oxidoreductase
MPAMTRGVRFGFQLSGEHARDPIGAARRAEALGFDVVAVADHVGPGWSPLVTLGAIAQATERIRLATMVLNNDMRNPVQLAWEAAALDRLSGGRVELGLGAGHTPQEYRATGIALDPPAVRKARLMESVGVIQRLFGGDPVTFTGDHYRLEDAQIEPPAQARLPILVGGNGATLLGRAGAAADIIGLQGLGRTLPDGHRHTVRWDPDWLSEQIDQVRAGAGARFGELELSALVQVVDITDDRGGALAALCASVDGLTVDQAAAVPYVLVGTADEIADQVRAAGRRWGITYFVVRELDAFAPVLAALGRG